MERSRKSPSVGDAVILNRMEVGGVNANQGGDKREGGKEGKGDGRGGRNQSEKQVPRELESIRARSTP